MKQLFLMLLCIILAAGCPYNGENGDDGKSGKNGTTSTIVQSYGKKTIELFSGEIPSGIQSYDLSMLEKYDYVEIKVFNVEEKTLCCPAYITFSFQIDDSDWYTIKIKNWQSVIFHADKDTKFNWYASPVGKNIKIDLIYDVLSQS